MKREVVITGLGCISPLGTGREDFWQALRQGKSAIAPLADFAVSTYPCRLGAQIRNFDPIPLIGKKGLRYIHQGTRYLAAATSLALDPDLDPHSTEIGVVIGFAFGNSKQTTDYTLAIMEQGPSELLPMASFDVALNASVNYIAVRFHLAGVSRSIAAGGTSSLEALGNAFELIRQGPWQTLIAGGVEQMALDSYLSLHHKGLLATGPSAPFGKNRNGLILGEGACVFLLEEKQAALARKAKIYGRILGYDTTFVGGLTPEGMYARMHKLLTDLLQQCDLPPAEVDLVAATANGSVLIDALEAQLIQQVWPQGIPVVVVKALLGEGRGVAGAFQTAGALLSLSTGELFPAGELDSAFELDLIQQPRSQACHYALVHCLEPEGNYAALLLGLD